MIAGRGVRHARGMAAIESLLAVPLLLFVGLGAVQFALVYQARHALAVALHEAARAGSVAHADDEAIRDGLARGMLPWLTGASDLEELAANAARARAHVAQAEGVGWLRLSRLSPTDASFADWAEPARDRFGARIDGIREIPNDDLVHRATRALPAGGAAGARGGDPIGAASGQTLADANLLRLRLEYGVPLSVPVAGRLVAWSLRTWHGCTAAVGRTWGVLRLDAPARGAAGDALACTMLGADAATGPRLPVSVSATVRMQTPARAAGAAAPLAVAAGAVTMPARSVPGAGSDAGPTRGPMAEPDASAAPTPPASPGEAPDAVPPSAGGGPAPPVATSSDSPAPIGPAASGTDPTALDPAFCRSADS